MVQNAHTIIVLKTNLQFITFEKLTCCKILKSVTLRYSTKSQLPFRSMVCDFENINKRYVRISSDAESHEEHGFFYYFEPF